VTTGGDRLISRKEAVWRRLGTRFDLSPEQQPTGAWLSTLITVCTDADALLRDPQLVRTSTASLGGGITGDQDANIVPTGKRWRLSVVEFLRDSGDNLINQILIKDVSFGQAIKIDTFTATADGHFFLPHKIVMEEDDIIRIGSTGAGSSSTIWTVNCWVEEEDIF